MFTATKYKLAYLAPVFTLPFFLLGYLGAADPPTSAATSTSAKSQPALEKLLADALKIAAKPGSVQLTRFVPLNSWSFNDDPDSRLALSMIFDKGSKGDTTYLPTAETLSDVYQDILANAKWASDPLDKDQQAQLAADKAVLFAGEGDKATPGYATYKEIKARLDAAKAKLDATPEAQRTAEMQLAYQEATEDMQLRGHAEIYVLAEDRFRRLVDLRSQKWLADSRELTKKSELKSSSGKTFLSINIQPDPSVTSAWTAFTSTLQNDAMSLKWSVFTKDGTPVADDIPPLPASLKIRFEALHLELERPWLDNNVLSNRAWKWADENSPPIAGGAQDKNRLAHFTTSVLVIRNLRLSGDWNPKQAAAFKKWIDAKHTICLGPVPIAGQSSDGNLYYYPRRESGDIVSLEMFVAGFELSPMPASPNPDPNMKW